MNAIEKKFQELKVLIDEIPSESIDKSMVWFYAKNKILEAEFWCSRFMNHKDSNLCDIPEDSSK